MDREAWMTEGQKTKRFNESQIIPDPVYATYRNLSLLLSGFKELKTGGRPGILLIELIKPGDKRNGWKGFYGYQEK